MFISQLQSDPQFYFAVIIVVVISICLHELAHGFTAIALGDRTPEETGHITLNPLVHMGPISLAMLALTGISWGAMPIDPTRLRGKYAETLVAFAGPATNLVLAGLAILSLGLWMRFGTIDRANHIVDNIFILLRVLGSYNLLLFAFNLIPVPPLDGSRIAANISPGYRRLTMDPTMQGVFFALLIGGVFGIGRLIAPAAMKGMSAAILFVAGR